MVQSEISKLPIRQITNGTLKGGDDNVSKLPIRQITDK